MIHLLPSLRPHRRPSIRESFESLESPTETLYSFFLHNETSENENQNSSSLFTQLNEKNVNQDDENVEEEQKISKINEEIKQKIKNLKKKTKFSQSKLLKFRMISCDGGIYGKNYEPENCVKPDESVYCSKNKENINILMELDFKNPKDFIYRGFNITHIIIKTTDGFTCNLKNGLIFILKKKPKSNFYGFDNFNKFRYDQYIKHKIENNTVSDDDPICYFELQNDSMYSIHELSTPRFGKYVFVKLLKSKTPTGKNIDLQFVGFLGYRGSHSYPCSSLNEI